MLGNHPSIVIPQNTPYAEEMRKHEAHHTVYGPPKRPYEYREFPKRVYKAVRGVTGVEFEGHTVGDEHEQRNLQSRGFYLSQTEAMAALEKAQTEAGILAAERNYEIQHGRISERAAAEVRQAEVDHGARHLPEVPVKPIRKRRTKAEMAAARG